MGMNNYKEVLMKVSDRVLQLLKDRYFLPEEESWEQCALRVAKAGSIPEKDPQTFQDKFFNIIYPMHFLPAGRILRNALRQRGSIFNCYHLPIGDSISEIGDFLKNALILWSDGGGVGCNFSTLRPKGSPISGYGETSSGAVSFLRAADAVGETIRHGGQRRAAGLASLDVSHPEIYDFVNAKSVDRVLSHFNLSVNVNKDFLEAVEKDGEWELTFKRIVYRTVRARDLWDKIVENMINYAEPGLLNWNYLTKNNSYYYDPVTGTNPCITGDTKVYVADGRRYVPIKELADEGKDVPVFCYNRKTQKPEVKMMRRPRITGYNKKILKVTLDDGSFIRCTENHKFYMKDGSIKRADELKPGDRLHHLVAYVASLEEVFRHSNSKSSNYIWLNAGFGNLSEHRLIAEFKLGRKLRAGEVVHHKDRDSLNNSSANLVVMAKEDHDRLHAADMLGEKNPMNRFPEKNWLVKQDHSGSNNGRFKGYTPDQVFDLAVKYSIELGRRVTQKEWFEYCRENNIPNSRYSLGKYTSPSKLLKAAAEKADVVVYDSSAHIRSYKHYLELLRETDLDIVFKDGRIYVNKKCEWCGKSFMVSWDNRERAFCSRKCSSDYGWNNEVSRSKFYSHCKNKQQETRNAQINVYNELKGTLGRDPLKKEWMDACKKKNVPFRIRSANESGFNEYCFTSYRELKEAAELNFVVVSVEEDGYEDVYNGTVDEHHNFYIMVSETETKSKKPKYNHVLCAQCGEAILSPWDVCDLGSIVLPKFVTSGGSLKQKELEETVKLAIRYLDNMIDINKYSIKEIEIKAHNSRRIGLGVMGLAEYLFAKKIRYGSEESISEIERVMKIIRNAAYTALVELAMEKGTFPKFDPYAYVNASFIRKLPASLRMDIKKHGTRCVTCLSVAPTGAISLLPEVSSGIEPLFSKAYVRKDGSGESVYIHKMYLDFVNSGEKIPDWYVDAYDLKPQDHFEVQSAVQKYVDGGVSKTINLPMDTKKEELSDLLLEYIWDLKGVTVYRDGSKSEQPLTALDESQVREYLKNNKAINEKCDEGSVSCAGGVCEI